MRLLGVERVDQLGMQFVSQRHTAKADDQGELTHDRSTLEQWRGTFMTGPLLWQGPA